MSVTIDCPWCDTAVALADREDDLACDGCGVVVEFAQDEPIRLAVAA